MPPHSSGVVEREQVQEQKVDVTNEMRSVTVRGLRYSLPVEAEQVTCIRDKFVGLAVLTAIASMWRLQRGEQPLPESEAHWQGEIAAGRVKLLRRKHHQMAPEEFWKAVELSDIVRHGDKVLVKSHRHERVVPAVQLVKLFENAKVIVVDKPAGLACTQDPGEVNSLRSVAAESFGVGVHLAHRLDISVTGCLIMGRSGKMMANVMKEMQHGLVRKVYIARAKGELPVSLQADACQLPTWQSGGSSLEAEDRATAMERPSLCIDMPLSFDTHGKSRCIIDPEHGKPSKTMVNWLRTLPDGTHVLRCLPTTGHRHQIRCHLASIGLPIANDELYGGTCPLSASTCPPAFSDDEAGTLQSYLGTASFAFREWCPKCARTAALLAGTHHHLQPDVETAEIWLRSWRYTMAAFSVDVASPLPAWSIV